MKELRELERLLTQGKINRREFLAKVSILGLTAAISPALLTMPAQAAMPKKGGRLRIGLSGGSTATSIDPRMLNDVGAQFLNSILRSHLVELDHKSNPIPELAEGWESSPDAKKWVFTIRKGVEFHNGKTMDIEDVIYSINLHRGKDSKSTAKSVCEAIEEVKAEGKDKLIFTLRKGNVDFPFIMNTYQIAVVPAGTTDFEKGMGTGPYILVSYEPGVRVLVKRNPNYWKEGRAHFDEVEILGIEDVVARTNALKTGQIDIMNKPDLKTVHLLEKDPEIQVVVINGTHHFTIPMRTDTPPFDNNDVRLGLKYAIDREQVLKLVLRGYGILGNDHPVSPAYRYYAHELPQREFDPDKAKYHLKKAGMLDHKFQLHVANIAFEGAVDTALLYKESAAKAGININVVREPDDGYWSDVWMKKPWTFSYYFGRPTEDWVLSLTYAADAAWNESFWKHERFNKLLREARAEIDETKRREMYVELQRILRDEGGTVIPTFFSYLMAATTKLKFENVSPHLEFDGFLLPERWWFET